MTCVKHFRCLTPAGHCESEGIELYLHHLIHKKQYATPKMSNLKVK